MQPSETSKIRDYVWAWVKEGKGLDVGCGPDKVHPECTGLDVIDKPGVVKGSAEKLPFSKGEFDWVYSAHCLEHLDRPEKAIAEMIRVLKIHGTLILYLPYKDWYDKPLGYPKYHKHHFRPSDIRAMVKKHWPDMWVVTEELRGGVRKNDEQEYGFLLIMRRQEAFDPKRFYIKNWPQLGDTYSLDALLRTLQEKYPGCEIHLAHENCGLFPDMPWVKHTPDMAGVAWDGVLCQITIGQYSNYLRREKHFYAFPCWLAVTLGWLDEEDIPEDPRPKPLVFTETEEAWAEQNKPKRPFVALFHHAGHFPRDWYDDRWKRVVEWLTGEGYSVIAFGTRSPGFKMDNFKDMTGKTTVRQAACLAAKAECAIGVDTGMFHVLPQLGVRSLVLSGPSRFDTTFSPTAEPIYRNDAGCQQCYNAVTKDWFSEGEEFPIHANCDCNHTDCMEAISVGRVIDKLEEMLGIVRKAEGLISVCMIVHNEEKQIMTAIKSVHEHADEVIVVDTGSTDRTKEIAVGFEKVQLFNYDAGNPIQSFSDARNFSFSKATCRYVMWLDGSNEVVDMGKIVDALKDHNYDLVRLFTKSGGDTYRRDRIGLRRFVKFVDRVHETMEGDGLRPTIVDSPVIRTWQKKVGREDSLARNVRLLKMMIDESTPGHPRYPRWVYYLARELGAMGKTQESLKYHRQRVKLGGFWEEQALSALQVVHILKNSGNPQAAIREAYEALKLCDGWRDAYYLIADCYYALKSYDIAIRWLNHAMEIPEPSTVLWKWESVYQYLPQLLMSMCYEAKGNRATALRWAEREKAAAPASQQARIDSRIEKLKSP